MYKQLTAGTKVTLNAANGRISRVVVEDRGDVVLICRPEEWMSAKMEGREPSQVGFKRTDVIKVHE